jgi:hypothetical protein
MNKSLKFKLKVKHTYFLLLFFIEEKTDIYRILYSHFMVKIHKSNI